ncbi:endonuclease/exonuclease/phosphatase family protein [Actinophytocola gossypii]|uniref:Endonuclease/exonuclease/phosphatase family protein n=1 Tax=Actinophytocola gossypii TaxID=2812003 RepID=A0ABT2J4W8_9PSEU|nr:endonuclease/exonuclease/phosphatase family protein [Actinophytocola gossypii]MCT2582907.1 endonuclease/exonuclease/phosphatase family protein [Actinophytocola gossypii]
MKRLLVAAAAVAAAFSLATPAGAVQARDYYLQFNMAGSSVNDGALGVARAVVSSVEDADVMPFVVTLNEVCANQYRHMESQLDDHGYVGTWGPTGPRCDSGEPYGNALFMRSGRTTVGNFDLPNEHGNEQRRLLCVRSNERDMFLGCVTHISHKAEDQDAQIAAVADRLNGFQDDGYRIVVGGDFNVTPGASALDPMYATCSGGDGRFHETDRATCGGRGGESTHGDRKIDYIFYSAHFSELWGDATRSSYSDHDPLWGRAVAGPA